MGTIASAVYNVNRTKKSQKALKPTDFMQKQPTQEPDQDSLPEKITATFRHMAAVFNAKPAKPTEPK